MAGRDTVPDGVNPYSSVCGRLSQLQQYFPPKKEGESKTPGQTTEARRVAMAANKAPITCHVLNTYTGRPGAGISCSLTLVGYEGNPASSSETQQQHQFTATTDSDGRVTNWSGPGEVTVSDILRRLPARNPSQRARSTWSLRLSRVDEWYRERGVEDCFWPEVEVRFAVDGCEGEEGWRHYHVPVLLGPWNYSTYRGS